MSLPLFDVPTIKESRIVAEPNCCPACNATTNGEAPIVGSRVRCHADCTDTDSRPFDGEIVEVKADGWYEMTGWPDRAAIRVHSQELERLQAPDIKRIITLKAGTWRELRDGKLTGREYRILELQSGQYVCEWNDGQRFPLGRNTHGAPAFTAEEIAAGLKDGTLVEVAS